jgi:hypothetical protein
MKCRLILEGELDGVQPINVEENSIRRKRVEVWSGTTLSTDF